MNMPGWGEPRNREMLSPIVLVYLNAYLPKYAARNLHYLEETFPGREIFVLVDKDKYAEKSYNLNRTKFVVLSDLKTEISGLRMLTNHPTGFRHDFWNVTIARFFAIEQFMITHNIDSVFHFEADVLVAPYFPFSELEKVKQKIAFPKVSNTSAAASVLYVNNPKTLSVMNAFFKVSLLDNPNWTDMKLLSEFTQTYNHLYFPLFSGIDPMKSNSQKIYDAATFGIYLTGGDPRNSGGWVESYRNVDDHDTKPNEFEFYITPENIVIAKIENHEFEIQNLHIHSKNVKYFMAPWPSKKLILQIQGSRVGIQNEFSFSAYRSLVYGFLTRRLMKIQRK